MGGRETTSLLWQDFYVYRSQIALGKADEVRRSIKDSAPMALQAVKMLAIYKSSRPGSAERDSCLNTLRDWMADSAISSNPLVRYLHSFAP